MLKERTLFLLAKVHWFIFCPGSTDYVYIDYPFSKHVLSTYYMPVTVLGAGNAPIVIVLTA